MVQASFEDLHLRDAAVPRWGSGYCCLTIIGTPDRPGVIVGNGSTVTVTVTVRVKVRVKVRVMARVRVRVRVRVAVRVRVRVRTGPRYA